MLRSAIKSLSERAGLYIKLKRNLPPGVEWLLDLERNIPLPNAPLVLDVGANTGQTTREIKAHFIDAQIHAFEPVQSTFDELVRKTKPLDSVICHHLALSDENANRVVRTLPFSKRNSICRDAFSKKTDTRQETITIQNTASFCKEYQIEEIDILKTDTEGHDLEVLRGAEPLFRKGRIKAVYVEVTFSQSHPGCTKFPDVFDFLCPHGFRLAGLYELFWFQYKPADEAWCNALFLKNDAASINRVP